MMKKGNMIEEGKKRLSNLLKRKLEKERIMFEQKCL